jgi:hypothetical protein
VTTKNKIVERIDMKIQGVSEISTLILTGNRTHQKEQLFLVVAQYRAIRISSFTRGFKWSQISNQLTNSQVTAQGKTAAICDFIYLFPRLLLSAF